MNPLAFPDRHYLNAALGWMGLGNPREAHAELERIAPGNRLHPDVLEVRFDVYARAQQWAVCVDLGRVLTRIAPGRAAGWVRWAQALHESGLTADAWEALERVADRFPDEARIPRDLARYASHLAKLRDSPAPIPSGQ